MADTRGVFGLKLAGSLKSKGEWVPLAQVFHNPSVGTLGAFNTGYFAGGGPSPSAKSTVDKMDFSTENTTYTPSANLNAARNYICGVGNKTSGYTCGGANPSSVSTVEKTSYANDTTANVPGAALSEARNFGGSSGGSNVGYYGGGSAKSIVDKITYSSDTTARIPGADLSGNRSNLTAVGNEDATYFAGGTPGPLTSVDKLLFSTDTTSRIPGADLSVARYEMGGAAGNLTSGYVAGGQPGYTVVDKITYSTDTAARVPGADLVLNNKLSFITTGNRLAGYYAGAGNSPQESRVQKLTYSSESTSSLPSNGYLSSTRGGGGGFSSRENGLGGAPSNPAARFSDGADITPNKGYMGGGNVSPGSNLSMDKMDFSVETFANTPSAYFPTAPNRLNVHRGTGSTTSTGYFIGDGDGGGVRSHADKLVYATDTTSLIPGARTPQEMGGMASMTNLNFAYFAGGYSTARLSSFMKLTYADETVANLPSSTQLSTTKLAAEGASSATTGYIAGGDTPSSPSHTSDIEKVTFSTDTVSSMPANLSQTNNYFASTGNSSAGYFCGGSPGKSHLDKLTYSSETCARNPSANLSHYVFNGSAMGSDVAGYYTGGEPSYKSITDKLTYSSETIERLPGANMNYPRHSANGNGGRQFGNPAMAILPSPTPSSTVFATGPNNAYIGGGDEPADGGANGRVSTVDKLSYSTDTTARVPGANLDTAREGAGGVASVSAAYFGGGSTSGGGAGVVSNTDKTTFSSDTTARIPGANLSVARFRLAGAHNGEKGYFAGGENSPGRRSTVDKLTYSNDTATATPALSIARSELAGVGNLTHAYFGAGVNNSGNRTSAVDRIDYSNDTRSRIPGADLDQGRNDLAAAGNDTAGYFGAATSGPGSPDTIAQKLTYGTETTALLPGADFGTSIMRYGAASSLSDAYYVGGANSSAAYKLTYSDESVSAVPSANLSAPRTRTAGASGRSNAIGQLSNIV